MALFWLIYLVVTLPLAYFCFSMASKLRRYEFEHRTSGGVVEFKDYGASRKHALKKHLLNLLCIPLGLLIFVGIIVFVFSVMGPIHHR